MKGELVQSTKLWVAHYHAVLLNPMDSASQKDQYSMTDTQEKCTGHHEFSIEIFVFFAFNFYRININNLGE